MSLRSITKQIFLLLDENNLSLTYLFSSLFCLKRTHREGSFGSRETIETMFIHSSFPTFFFISKTKMTQKSFETFSRDSLGCVILDTSDDQRPHELWDFCFSGYQFKSHKHLRVKSISVSDRVDS